MLLPSSELAVLLLLALALVSSGSWTSLFAATRKWRFELFYYDFAIGFLLAAVIAAATLGSWNSRELTFQDNFLLASRRQMLWVAGSGLLLGLGDLFLLAGATLAGTGVSFMVTYSTVVAMDTAWDVLVNRDANLVLTSSGMALAILAAIAAVVAHRWHLTERENAEAQALRADPRLKKPVSARPGAASGTLLALLAGILLTCFQRLLAGSLFGDGAVAPYNALLLLSAGVAGAAVAFLPFFLYFPLRGGALKVRHYFKGNKTHHFLGLCGGLVGGIAVLASMLSATAPGSLHPAPVLASYLSFGTPLVAVIWGFFVRRELADAVFRVNLIFLITVVLLLTAIGMIAVTAG